MPPQTDRPNDENAVSPGQGPGKICCDRLSRRAVRREERREAILDVAQKSFLKHGYAGTTMSAIAAALGGSKGTLWNYYSSKDALFGDVLDRATIDLREQMSLAIDGEQPLATALLKVASRFLAQIISSEGIALHRLVVGEAGRFPEIGQLFYDRAIQRVISPVSQFISLAMERGELRRDDPVQAAHVFCALCMAGTHLKLVTGAAKQAGRDEAMRLARNAVDNFFRIYR